MILCGWCGQPTEPGRCGACHRDPAIPWLQRGTEPETVDPRDAYRRRLADATTELQARGQRVTAESLADHLDISPRTVRRWQQMSAS